jgi:ribosomal-protein-alanine N-acetyltransferase
MKTKRLELIAGTPDLVRAQISDREHFARLLEARVPRAREQEPDHQEVMENMAQSLEKGPEQVGWWCWYLLLHNRVTGHRVLIGDGGFKGPPDEVGTVEIGYSMLQPYRNKGYTTEAVKALVSWGFQHSQVTRVIAEAQPGNTASIRVLQKAGFDEVGPGSRRSLVRFEIGRQDLRA